MRVIPVKLDEETIASLDAETELFGFDSRSAYVRWIVERREAIDRDAMDDKAAPAIESRLEHLEAQIERLAESVDSTPDDESTASAPTESTQNTPNQTTASAPTESTQNTPNQTTASAPTESTQSTPTESTQNTPTESTAKITSDDESSPYHSEDPYPERSDDVGERTEAETHHTSESEEPATPDESNADSDHRTTEQTMVTAPGSHTASAEQHQTDEADDEPGWKRTQTDPSVRLRGSPRTTVSATADADDGSGEQADRVTAEGQGTETSSESSAGTNSGETSGGLEMNLTPERVARIPDPDVEDDAGVLGNVELHRLDEMTRRAVASSAAAGHDTDAGENRTKTAEGARSRSGGVTTGRTTLQGLSGAGALPGESLVDLDALDVPGRSDRTIRKRRRLAGRAVKYLRDNGSAKKGDFVDALFEECPAEYDTPDGWWRCVKHTLKQIDAVEGGDGSRIWRYVGSSA